MVLMVLKARGWGKEDAEGWPPSEWSYIFRGGASPPKSAPPLGAKGGKLDPGGGW